MNPSRNSYILEINLGQSNLKKLVLAQFEVFLTKTMPWRYLHGNLLLKTNNKTNDHITVTVKFPIFRQRTIIMLPLWSGWFASSPWQPSREAKCACQPWSSVYVCSNSWLPPLNTPTSRLYNTLTLVFTDHTVSLRL